LYASPTVIRIIKSRRMKWAGYVARMGLKRNSYRLVMGKPEGKCLLGRTRRRWMDNIKMVLGEVRWCCFNWIRVAQDRDKCRVVVNAVMSHRVPQSAGKLSSGCTNFGLSTGAQLHKFS
jgi:hypothetical protein